MILPLNIGLGHLLDYTCLGMYLLIDFSMLSRWPCLWTPNLSQSWEPSAASLYPFTLFCRKAALCGTLSDPPRCLEVLQVLVKPPKSRSLTFVQALSGSPGTLG